MNKGLLFGILICSCIDCFATVHHVKAAACPIEAAYATITYQHQLVNEYGAATIGVDLYGTVGIEISPSGIANAGHNKLEKLLTSFYSTNLCDCIADPVTTDVTFTVTGFCDETRTLVMRIREEDQPASATMRCTGHESCEDTIAVYPAGTVEYDLEMGYWDENIVTKPYNCPTCSGTYSWQLNFTDKPPLDDVPLAPIVPALQLLLLQKSWE